MFISYYEREVKRQTSWVFLLDFVKQKKKKKQTRSCYESSDWVIYYQKIVYISQVTKLNLF